MHRCIRIGLTRAWCHANNFDRTSLTMWLHSTCQPFGPCLGPLITKMLYHMQHFLVRELIPIEDGSRARVGNVGLLRIIRGIDWIRRRRKRRPSWKLQHVLYSGHDYIVSSDCHGDAGAHARGKGGTMASVHSSRYGRFSVRCELISCTTFLIRSCRLITAREMFCKYEFLYVQSRCTYIYNI